jgi:hypothetical protein
MEFIAHIGVPRPVLQEATVLQVMDCVRDPASRDWMPAEAESLLSQLLQSDPHTMHAAEFDRRVEAILAVINRAKRTTEGVPCANR